MTSKKRIQKCNKSWTMNHETGEVTIERHEETFFINNQKRYVMLYLDNPINAVGRTINISPLLYNILEIMTYSDADNQEYGGQIIHINKAFKMQISRETSLTIDAIEKQIQTLIKDCILLRLQKGMYQINPYVFSKGKPIDVDACREHFKMKISTATIKAAS